VTAEAQDPNELFDIVRADGSPTGQIKPRAQVHRDGDWHRAVHVWVAGHDAEGEPFVMFQQRSLAKDTFPGRLDATVGGHYRAGEGLEQALREIEEEIGIVPDPGALRLLGTRVAVNEAEPGTIDRELQDVFLLIDERPLREFRPHPAEVAALIRFRLNNLLPVLAADSGSLDGNVFQPGEPARTRVRFEAADFVKGGDRYFYRVAIAVANALRGDTYVAI
jgi:isopentenyldiphosphate isomerase